MKQNFWDKRIPTFFGLFLTIIGVIITSYLANKQTSLRILASPTAIPEKIRITNISDSSFSVSFVTKENVVPVILFGKNQNMENQSTDERGKTHHVTVNNLEPNTKYFFVIVSKDKTYSNNNAAFEVTTASDLDLKVSSTEKKITGQVILPNGQFPDEGIAYLTGENIQPLSTVLKEDGEYEFDIKSARNQNLSAYFSSSVSDVLSVNIVSEALESEIKILSGKDNIPVIILSKNYDFTAVFDEENLSTKEATSAGFPLSSVKTASDTLTILSPKNNETFLDQRPLFKGTGKPGSTIRITINSNEKIETRVKVDNFGNWIYRPGTNLSAGNHTITIVATDEKNPLRTIIRSFTVFASGSQVTESATPSATPTFTPSPIPTQTPIPTAVPTIAPTIIPTSTPIPTQAPSPTPIPIPTTKISPPTKPPGDFSGIIVGSIGFGTILIGMLLFLFNRSPRKSLTGAGS